MMMASKLWYTDVVINWPCNPHNGGSSHDVVTKMCWPRCGHWLLSVFTLSLTGFAKHRLPGYPADLVIRKPYEFIVPALYKAGKRRRNMKQTVFHQYTLKCFAKRICTYILLFICMIPIKIFLPVVKTTKFRNYVQNWFKCFYGYVLFQIFSSLYIENSHIILVTCPICSLCLTDKILFERGDLTMTWRLL